MSRLRRPAARDTVTGATSARICLVIGKLVRQDRIGEALALLTPNPHDFENKGIMSQAKVATHSDLTNRLIAPVQKWPAGNICVESMTIEMIPRLKRSVDRGHIFGWIETGMTILKHNAGPGRGAVERLW
jgi:hypothetical protein